MMKTVRFSGNGAHVFLHDAFGLVIQGAGGLVQDQDARVGDQRPGDGDALALAAGQIAALLPDQGVIALAPVPG